MPWEPLSPSGFGIIILNVLGKEKCFENAAVVTIMPDHNKNRLGFVVFIVWGFLCVCVVLFLNSRL